MALDTNVTEASWSTTSWGIHTIGVGSWRSMSGARSVLECTPLRIYTRCRVNERITLEIGLTSSNSDRSDRPSGGSRSRQGLGSSSSEGRHRRGPASGGGTSV